MNLSNWWRGSFLLMLSFIIYVEQKCVENVPKLILISVDGFRYDYLDKLQRHEVEHFQHFIDNGVRAEYVINVFPTVTYSNHYTMITGLYPESHGIIHNVFYDPVGNKYHASDNLGDNFDSFWYSDGAEPIYVTNDKSDSNRRTGSVTWPAGLAKVKGVAPDKVMPGKTCHSDISYHERVDVLMSWFTAEDPINLGLLYFPELDIIGHQYGPESEEVKKAIKEEFNDVLGYLLEKLRKADLLDDINIILTSDHGMSPVTTQVVLEDYINSEWYFTGTQDKDHATVEIYPKKDSYLQLIYSSLSKCPDLNVYKKDSRALKDLHYNNNIRIAPLVVTGKEGVLIYRNKSEAIKDKGVTIGMHGNNPDTVKDLRPFFMAVGPAFKTGVSSGPIDMVDIYPLMCQILGIVPAPNNGSLDRVIHLLKDTEDAADAGIFSAIFLNFSAVCAAVSAVLAVCLFRNDRNRYRRKLKLNPECRQTGTILQTTTE